MHRVDKLTPIQPQHPPSFLALQFVHTSSALVLCTELPSSCPDNLGTLSLFCLQKQSVRTSSELLLCTGLTSSLLCSGSTLQVFFLHTHLQCRSYVHRIDKLTPSSHGRLPILFLHTLRRVDELAHMQSWHPLSSPPLCQVVPTSSVLAQCAEWTN